MKKKSRKVIVNITQLCLLLGGMVVVSNCRFDDVGNENSSGGASNTAKATSLSNNEDEICGNVEINGFTDESTNIAYLLINNSSKSSVQIKRANQNSLFSNDVNVMLSPDSAQIIDVTLGTGFNPQALLLMQPPKIIQEPTSKRYYIGYEENSEGNAFIGNVQVNNSICKAAVQITDRHLVDNILNSIQLKISDDINYYAYCSTLHYPYPADVCGTKFTIAPDKPGSSPIILSTQDPKFRVGALAIKGKDYRVISASLTGIAPFSVDNSTLGPNILPTDPHLGEALLNTLFMQHEHNMRSQLLKEMEDGRYLLDDKHEFTTSLLSDYGYNVIDTSTRSDGNKPLQSGNGVVDEVPKGGGSVLDVLCPECIAVFKADALLMKLMFHFNFGPGKIPNPPSVPPSEYSSEPGVPIFQEPVIENGRTSPWIAFDDYIRPYFELGIKLPKNPKKPKRPDDDDDSDTDICGISSLTETSRNEDGITYVFKLRNNTDKYNKYNYNTKGGVKVLKVEIMEHKTGSPEIKTNRFKLLSDCGASIDENYCKRKNGSSSSALKANTTLMPGDEVYAPIQWPVGTGNQDSSMARLKVTLQCSNKAYVKYSTAMYGAY